VKFSVILKPYVGTAAPGRPSRVQLGRLLARSGRELRVILCVVIITHTEEANVGPTLQSVPPLALDSQGKTMVADSGSTDHCASR
jgi:hypothetical protein